MVVFPAGFTFPPTDGSLPPASAIDFHHRHNPSHAFAVLHDATKSSPTTITYEELARAVHRVSYILNPGSAIPQGSNIGLLVSTSSLEYTIIILGAMRAGLVPFPMSPRVHPSGIAHLLITTETSLVVAGGSDAIDNATTQLSATLNKSNFSAKFIGLTTLGDILSFVKPSEAGFKPFPPLGPMDDSSISAILHSSGSTGMPKAIKYHLKGIFKNIINQPIGWTISGPSARVGTMALPTFHCMGVILQVLAPLYMGYTQALFAPARIPVMPNPSLALEAIANTNCDFLICVPTFLDAWVNDENAIAILKRMKGIMFGGGPLIDAVGDKLTDHGVKIYPLYGATEVGIVNVAPPLDQARPWNCIELSPQIKPYFISQNDEDNTFELVFEAGDDHYPFVLNWELNGKAVYRTRDLLAPHPSESNLWKFVGRVDDQIVLLNGEKTNPGPMETEIAKCPLVHSAIMFGQARNQTGVLIELKEISGPLSEIEKNRRELLGVLRPYIQRANQTSATHSRLDERAVVFVDRSRPLPRTPKGTIPRSAVLKLYAPDIEDMYEALEQEVDADPLAEVQPSEAWTRPEIISGWIVRRIKDILGWDIDTTVDLFQQGMDSLTATMLLRDLKAALHASQDPKLQTYARTLNLTVVFDNPTVQQLACILVQCLARPNVPNNQATIVLENIRAMIEKYDSNWPQVRASYPMHRSDMHREHVVVTGTTGALGSHLLSQLLTNDRVERVWALNRESSGGISIKQKASFEDKMLDVQLLASEKLVFVDAVLDDAKLGLSDELYDEIRTTATIIIHNAWQVNFNLALQSFEPNIRGTRNLLDLAPSLTAPTGLPRFAFASSISVAGTSGLGEQLEEVSVRPEDAASTMGYGQSKLVAEKLLESARRAGLQTCVIRLGQLTGDITSGSWNSTDWVPSIVASSLSVRCLPAAVGTVSWLPLDVAAGAIIDTCTTHDDELPAIIHASHPRSVPWADIMSAFSDVLATHTGTPLPVVEFGEWSKKVTDSALSFQGSDIDRYKRFPSTKIQGVVDGMVRADQLLRSGEGSEMVESAGTVRLVTTRAEQMSEGLRSTPKLGREHVEKWVDYWTAKGLFA